MLDNLPVDPDSRGDHRKAASHVLDQFVAALSPRPWCVGQRHDADIHPLNQGNLTVFRPCGKLKPQNRLCWVARSDRPDCRAVIANGRARRAVAVKTQDGVVVYVAVEEVGVMMAVFGKIGMNAARKAMAQDLKDIAAKAENRA